MKKISIILSGLILFLCSCSHPKLGEGILDLKDISMKFNVLNYYQDEINYTNGINDKINGDKKPSLSDVKDVFSHNFISVDTLTYSEDGDWVKDEWVKEKTKTIGIQYNMSSWSTDKCLAKFGDLQYFKVNMMTTPNGEFMALVTCLDETDKNIFQKTVDDLTGKYGIPEIKEDDFFGAYKNKTWNTKDRLIQLVSKDESAETYLFVINKEYKDSLRGKFSEGDWLFLK